MYYVPSLPTGIIVLCTYFSDIIITCDDPYIHMPPTQSPVHLLLTHFWEAVAEDLAVEFAAAAQGNGGGGGVLRLAGQSTLRGLGIG